MSQEGSNPTPPKAEVPWLMVGAGVLLAVGGLVGLCVWLMMPGRPVVASGPVVAVGHVPNEALGAKLYMQSCASCHGPKGHGMPHQGATLRQSKYVAAKTDAELVEFIKEGRLAGSSDSVMNLVMPAKGNNPNLTDDDLLDIIAHIRVLQKEATSTSP